MPEHKVKHNIGDTVYFVWWNQMQRSTITGYRIIVDPTKILYKYTVAPFDKMKEEVTLLEGQVFESEGLLIAAFHDKFEKMYGEKNT